MLKRHDFIHGERGTLLGWFLKFPVSGPRANPGDCGGIFADEVGQFLVA